MTMDFENDVCFYLCLLDLHMLVYYIGWSDPITMSSYLMKAYASSYSYRHSINILIMYNKGKDVYPTSFDACVIPLYVLK